MSTPLYRISSVFNSNYYRRLVWVGLLLLIGLCVVLQPSKTYAVEGVNNDMLANLQLYTMINEGEPVSLDTAFEPTKRNYTAIVNEDVADLRMAIYKQVEDSDYFQVYGNAGNDGYYYLHLQYGLNTFKIAQSETSANPYILTVIRGNASPDFTWLHEADNSSYIALGDSVVKSLPIGNNEMVHIANKIKNTDGEINYSVIFKTDFVGTITSSKEFDHITLKDIAPLPGQPGKYVIIGDQRYYGSFTPIIQIVEEDETDPAHKTFKRVGTPEGFANNGDKDRLQAVLPSSRTNEFIVMYHSSVNGVYGFTVKRYGWNPTSTSFYDVGAPQSFDATGTLTTAQMIKGIGSEQYVVLANQYYDGKSYSRGKVYMLQYAPVDGVYTYNPGSSWNKDIPANTTDARFYSITSTVAGNYIAAGFDGDIGSSSNILIQPIMASNAADLVSTQIKKEFGDSNVFGEEGGEGYEGEDYLLFIQQSSDQSYIIGTSMKKDYSDHPSGLLVKLNSSFTTQWKKSFADRDTDVFLRGLSKQTNGDIVISGSIFESGYNVGFNNVGIEGGTEPDFSDYGYGFIAKLASSNAILSKIEYGGNALVLENAKYNLTLPSTVSSADLTLSLESDKASTIIVKQTGTVVASVYGSTLRLQSLISGLHTVKIRVTSEDLTTTKDYDIQVTVAPAPIPTSNANLTKIQYGNSDLLFDGSKYNLSVGSVIDNVYLKLVYAGMGASYVVTSSGGTVTATVYDTLKISALPTGTHTIKIRVTAEDLTTTKDYDIQVIRQVVLGIEQVVIPGAAQMEFEGGVNIQFNGAQIAPGSKITATLISNPPNITGSPLRTAGKILNFTLSGITLNPSQPITLQLPVDSSTNAAKVGIFYYNETTLKWEYIDTQVVNGIAVAKVTHFSIYGVFESEQVAALQRSSAFLANGQTEVTLASSTSEAEIYYTLDTSSPTRQSLRYNPALKPALNVGQVLTAIAMKNGMLNSTIITLQAQQKPDVSYVIQQISNRVDVNNDGVFDRADVYYLLKLVPPYLVK